MDDLFRYLAPIYAVLIGLEIAVTRRTRPGTYDVRDTAASLSLSLTNLVAVILTRGATVALFFAVQPYALLALPSTPATFAVAIVAQDFTIYWLHRAYHRIRVLWAIHVVHHSSRRMNLGTALRLSSLEPLVDPLFHVPMVLAGFDPVMMLAAATVNQIYGFYLHTEVIRKLGPLEYVLVTPSHHRVHHGRNSQYLDRNYGIMFILWDRLFGTFEPEGEQVDYGLTENISSYNPIRITFHEWIALAKDLTRVGSWRQRVGLCLLPPGRSAPLAEPCAAGEPSR